MKRNRTVLLVVAAALVALGVLSSRCADDADPVKQQAKAEARVRAEQVVFPRDARRRRPPPTVARPGEPPKRHREPGADSIQRAMAFKDGGAVFVEVNAIRHSQLVEKLLSCRQDEASDALRTFKEQLGVDPFEDVDRIALHDEVFAASGFFEELKLPDDVGEPEPYGDGSQIYRFTDPDDPSGKPTVLGKVSDGLLLMSEDEAQVRAAIDRAEGRGDNAAPLPPHVLGTEVYGRFGPELLGQLLGGADASGGGDALVKRVAEIVTDGTVRVLVDDAVSMSLDLETNDEQGGEDLAKAIGGALAAARQQAESEGNEDLSALLDKARVLKQDNGRFGIDLAVPGDTILEAMGCKDGSPASVDEEAVPAAP